jgi:hypothetical protein
LDRVADTRELLAYWAPTRRPSRRGTPSRKLGEFTITSSCGVLTSQKRWLKLK